MRTGLIVALLGLLASASPVAAQVAKEQWCVDKPSVCIESEPYQSTTYSHTAASPGSNYLNMLGDQTTAGFRGWNTDPIDAEASIFLKDSGGAYCIAAESPNSGNCILVVSTDATILAALPNRDASKMVRFLKTRDDGRGGDLRIGDQHMNRLAAWSTAKRVALRWYQYYGSGFQWNGDGTCDNGKITHSSGVGTWAALPLLTHSINSSGNSNYLYTFYNTTGWTWNGHGDFEGFGGTAPGLGAGHPSRETACLTDSTRTYLGKTFGPHGQPAPGGFYLAVLGSGRVSVYLKEA